MRRVHPFGSLVLLVTLLAVALPARGQIPPPPPPTRDQEATERAWDISHPGWRQWYNKPTEKQAKPSDAPNRPVTSEQTKEEEKSREAQRRQLEQFWQQVQAQQARQQLQEAQRQEAFDRAKQALLANFRIPSGTIEAGRLHPAPDGRRIATHEPPVSVQTAFGLPPAVSESRADGLSEQQWQQARQYQGLIDTLQRSSETTTQDEAILEMAEIRRAALWKKAAGAPGLADDAREALALRLPVVEPKWPPPRLTRQDLEQIESPAHPPGEPSALRAPALLDCVQGLADAGVTDSLLAEECAERFGDFLGLAKIVMTTGEEGVAGGIAASVDFVVGKIPFPQANAAVEGGRIYSKVAFQAMNRFMSEAMKAGGGNFDQDAFWDDFKNDLTVWQKAMMEFVDYGPKE